MPLYLRINPRNGYPVYLQLVEQIRRAIGIGILKPGEQLPTVKQLSTELIVNPATVSRAIRELEHLGLVRSLPGRGAFVTGTDGATATSAHQDVVAEQIDAAVREARALNVPASRLRDALHDALARWYDDEERQAEET